MTSTPSFLKALTLSIFMAGFVLATPSASFANDEVTAEPKTETATEEPAAEATEAKVEPKGDLLKYIEGDRVLGNPDAPIIIIEYASLSCTHCAHFHTETFPKLEEQYIKTGKVALVFRHFPFNEPALRGAMLAECGGTDTKKFFTYLKVLFGAQDKWAFDNNFEASLQTLSSVGGMSQETFSACMADEELKKRLVAGVQWAADRLKVSSTPTFFINGEMVQGFRSIDALGEIIDKKLKEMGAE